MTSLVIAAVLLCGIMSCRAWHLFDRIDLEIISADCPKTDRLIDGSGVPADPYVWVTYAEHDSIGSGTLKFPVFFGRSSVQHDSRKPKWSEHVRYDRRADSHPFKVTTDGYLKLELWDKDVTFDDFVGECFVDLRTLTQDRNGTETTARLSYNGAHLTYRISVWLEGDRRLPSLPI